MLLVGPNLPGWLYHLSGASPYHQMVQRIVDPAEVHIRILSEWMTIGLVSALLAMMAIDPYYAPRFEASVHLSEEMELEHGWHACA